MVLWCSSGSMLLFKGITLSKDFSPNLRFFLLGFALFFGVLKAQFALKKSIKRLLRRYAAYSRSIPLKEVYTKSYALLILLMVGLGFLFKFGPIPLPLRVVVDVTVGFALLFSWVLVICGKGSLFGSAQRDISAR